MTWVGLETFTYVVGKRLSVSVIYRDESRLFMGWIRQQKISKTLILSVKRNKSRKDLKKFCSEVRHVERVVLTVSSCDNSLLPYTLAVRSSTLDEQGVYMTVTNRDQNVSGNIVAGTPVLVCTLRVSQSNRRGYKNDVTEEDQVNLFQKSKVWDYKNITGHS